MKQSVLKSTEVSLSEENSDRRGNICLTASLVVGLACGNRYLEAFSKLVSCSLCSIFITDLSELLYKELVSASSKTDIFACLNCELSFLKGFFFSNLFCNRFELALPAELPQFMRTGSSAPRSKELSPLKELKASFRLVSED